MMYRPRRGPIQSATHGRQQISYIRHGRLMGRLYRLQIGAAQLLWQGHHFLSRLIDLMEGLQKGISSLGVSSSCWTWLHSMVCCCSIGGLFALNIGALGRFGFFLWGATWRPWVDEGRLVVMLLFGVVYLSSPLIYLTLMEEVRLLMTQTGREIGTQFILGDQDGPVGGRANTESEGAVHLVWQALGGNKSGRVVGPLT